VTGTIRKQLLYQPGELAKVGQILIIESLPDGESKSGKKLWDELDDHCTAHPVNLRIGYCPANSAAEMLGYLDDLRADIDATGLNAILHIECHGSDDATGLILADWSFLSWDELKPKLVAINIASGFNLVLILGCCYGGSFGRTTRLEERAAFCAYLGPNSSIAAGMLFAGLLAFYKALFIERDITAAVNAMVNTVPDMPYFFATASGLFHLGFVAYIRDQATGQSLADRAESLAQQCRDAQMSPQLTAEDFARAIKDIERPAFEQLRRHHFALDLLPGNGSRFQLSYEKALRDAAPPGP
jgi:hypothetical protein